MLSEMSEPEMQGWARYFEVEPWGGGRDDLRFGLLLSLIAHAHGGSQKPHDFFPTLKAPDDPRETFAALAAMAQRVNG